MDWNIVRERIEQQKLEIISNWKHWDALNDLSVPKASVLIPLFVYQDQVYVLLTKRSQNLKYQPGDVCYPGGKQEKRDKSLVDTALRETYEEIGLSSSNVEILGELIPCIAIGRILVTPVIGVINVESVTKLKLNYKEVDDIFACPLSFFLKSESHKMVKSKYPEFKSKIHSFMWKKDVKLYEPCLENSFLRQVFVESKYDETLIYGLTGFFSLLSATFCLNASAEFRDGSITYDDLSKFQIELLKDLFVSLKSESTSKM